jgi:cytochrome P450
MLSPGFRHDRVIALQSIMSRKAMDWIQDIHQQLHHAEAAGGVPSVTVDMNAVMRGITLAIISSAAFGNGLDQPEDAAVVHRAIGRGLECASARAFSRIDDIPVVRHLPLLHKAEMKRIQDEYIALTIRLVRDRRLGKNRSSASSQDGSCTDSSSDDGDLLDLVLRATDDNGLGFSEDQVLNEVGSFIFGQFTHFAFCSRMSKRGAGEIPNTDG